jgi:hypothetical protein
MQTSGSTWKHSILTEFLSYSRTYTPSKKRWGVPTPGILQHKIAHSIYMSCLLFYPILGRWIEHVPWPSTRRHHGRSYKRSRVGAPYLTSALIGKYLRCAPSIPDGKITGRLVDNFPWSIISINIRKALIFHKTTTQISIKQLKQKGNKSAPRNL